MSDLYNEFPSWGETGDYPQDGFFYEGGDQVNEKHMDALWNGVQKHIDNLNTAIRDRVRDLHGNVVLDQGLVASIGGGTREVDVTASNDGAYVSGQYTGSVSAQTTSHTANSGGSTRTDVVYLGQDGNVSKSEGTASEPADTLKIAEVDVATDDSINDVRNYARDHAHVIASENQPTGAEPGDLWQDHTANREKVYQNGAWRKLLTEQDSATITAGDGLKSGGSFDLDGGSVTLDIEPNDFAGSGLQDDGSDNLELSDNSLSVTAGDGLKGGGSVNLGGSTTLNIEPSDFAGNGLQDDGNDNLEVDINTGISVREDGTIVLSQTEDVNFSTGVTAIDDGDGTASVVTNVIITDQFSMSTVSYDNKNLSVSYNISGGEFADSGKKFYGTSYFGSDTVYEYTVSDRYEIETASLTNTLDVGSEDSQPVGVTFNDTGSKMYLAGRSSTTVYSYNLSTSHDISTASYNDQYSVSGEISTLESVTFNESGSRMYVTDSDNGDIQSYTLSTAYSISTASPHNTLDVSGAVIEIEDVTFGTSGKRMVVLSSDGTIVGYDLSTAYDITTALETGTYVASEASSPFGIALNKIGTRMYVADYGNQSVYEYSCGNIGTGYI